MASCGGGRGGHEDQRPPYGGGGGGGGRQHNAFVCPPPPSTTRPMPAQYHHQVPMAPMVLPQQAAYGAPAAAPAPAAPEGSFALAPALAAVPVTIRGPPSSASPAPSSVPAPRRQLAQGAPTRLPGPAPASSAPPAGQVVAAEDALDVDLAPVSKKRLALAHPARPGLGTVGKKVAKHFLVDVADNNLFHYDVSINPESKSRTTNVFLGGKLPAYDGRKSLYTAGSLPFESEKFVVTPVDPEKKEKERAEREYKITIRIAGRTDMYHLHQLLCGRQRDMSQETIQVLDVVLRESPSWNYVTVSRYFFSTTFGHRGDIGEGFECWRGYYQSLRPTQMGHSLNIDISATSFFKPVTVIKFLEEFLSMRDTSQALSDRDRVKIKKALRGVRIETSHQPDQIRRYKITGMTPIPMSQLIFPVDEKGTRKTVVQYFWDKYNYRLKFGSWPCLQAGSDSRPVYLPMEVCKIVEGQRYSKKLNDRQVTNILRTTCKRPQEREQSIRDMVLHKKYAEDRFAQEFGIRVCSDLIAVPARVLPPPLLKYHDSGREKTCAPSAGQWNMINKKMINGGTIDNWTCLNFSRMRPEEVQRFCMDLTHMCNATGMSVNPRPFVEVKSAAPTHIENALRDVHRRATQMLAQQGPGSQLQLLIVILPDVSGSYGKIKRVCETDIGIVSQCCLPKHAIRPNKQYLENAALKINVKVGGRNTVLERAFVRNGIPYVSDIPTIIFGADVTPPPPGEDLASSIAAVVASMDWPEITKYRGLVSAQPHRQEIIEDLFTVSKDPQKGHNVNGGMIRELLIAFRKKINRRPERIIFYTDGVSEGQFNHVLLHEMDAIRKACASLEEGYLPPVTFVVVQKRHHTRLFPDFHGRHDMTDKSGNILPGTVVDQKIWQPTELCSQAGIQGTNHVLYDENHFTSDALQSLTNNHGRRDMSDMSGDVLTGSLTESCNVDLAASDAHSYVERGSTSSDCDSEICVTVQMFSTEVYVKTKRYDSVRVAICSAMRKLNVCTEDYWVICKNSNRRMERDDSITDNCILELWGLLRGGANDIGSSSGTARRIPILEHIMKLKRQGKWFEKVPLPQNLKRKSETRSFVIILAEGGQVILMKILQCIELVHARKSAFSSAFTINDIYYLPDYDVIEIDIRTQRIRKDLYEMNLSCVIPVLNSHFNYIDASGASKYPMYIDDLICRIKNLGSWSNRNAYLSVKHRSLVFNHPSTKSCSTIAGIFTNLVLKFNTIRDKGKLKGYLNGSASRNVNKWLADVGDTDAPFEMKRVLNYQVFDRSIGRYRNKLYEGTVYGQFDFSRCLITHGISINISIKQIVVALFVLWTTQLPEIQRTLMIHYKPPATSNTSSFASASTLVSSSGSISEHQITVVSDVHIHEIFGLLLRPDI